MREYKGRTEIKTKPPFRLTSSVLLIKKTLTVQWQIIRSLLRITQASSSAPFHSLTHPLLPLSSLFLNA